MIPHVWFKLLPSDTDIYDTIAFLLGQEGSLFFNVLEKTKILLKRGEITIVDFQKLKKLRYMDGLVNPIYYGI